MTPLAHLILHLLGDDIKVAHGETLPLIAQSSVVTSQAALAIHDLRILLNELVVLSSLDIEAFMANPSPYNPMLGEFRRFAGYQNVLGKLNYCLRGSCLLNPDFKQRHLQSPLSFRCLATVLGAALDALWYCDKQIAIELNAHQQNPLAIHEKDCMMPCAHFDMQSISSALDFARIALAPVLTTQVERSIKLLQSSQTNLTDGLEPANDNGGCGLSEIAFPLQALAAESKLLIQPVSAEIGSSMQAEGIEDRMNMAGLAGRRLQEMVSLGFMIASISAVISCQAIDLRNKTRQSGPVYKLGHNVEILKSCIRSIIPELTPNESPPKSLTSLVDKLKDGVLSKSIKLSEYQNAKDAFTFSETKSNL